MDPPLEKLLRESKALKVRVEVLERENALLKKSVYDLSIGRLFSPASTQNANIPSSSYPVPAPAPAPAQFPFVPSASPRNLSLSELTSASIMSNASSTSNPSQPLQIAPNSVVNFKAIEGTAESSRASSLSSVGASSLTSPSLPFSSSLPSSTTTSTPQTAHSSVMAISTDLQKPPSTHPSNPTPSSLPPASPPALMANVPAMSVQSIMQTSASQPPSERPSPSTTTAHSSFTSNSTSTSTTTMANNLSNLSNLSNNLSSNNNSNNNNNISTLGSNSGSSSTWTARAELRGHEGAVYAASFSPCGRFLATGSFDRSVRIWQPQVQTSETAILRQHTLNVSDLSWSNDSLTLLSGAYDQTCKTWDTTQSRLESSFDALGFVQCVAFNPTNNSLFYAGTSRNALTLFDRRSQSLPITHLNETGMVNSLHCFPDGIHVLTADSTGHLKTWDTRTGKVVMSFLNEPSRKPISHVAFSPALTPSFDFASHKMPAGAGVGAGTGTRSDAVKSEAWFMAVNSYDNIIRIYGYGFGAESPNSATITTDTTTTTTPISSPSPLSPSVPLAELKLVYSLKGGHKNKNWPVKSAFFSGNLPFSSSNGSGGNSTGPSLIQRTSSQSEFLDDDSNYMLPQHIHHHSQHHHSRHTSSSPSTSQPSPLLLATGSADPYVYIYNATASSSNDLVQRLEGHTDRVYAVAFHPTDPILVSVSADFTARVWGMSGTTSGNTKRRNK